MEWSVARPKPMLILLLCHPQVRPLCSNTPVITTIVPVSVYHHVSYAETYSRCKVMEKKAYVRSVGRKEE